MKVFLINPKTSFPGKLPPFPLGLLQIAALPAKSGHEIELLDCNITSISKIKRKIKNSDPDIVGFTTWTCKSLYSAIEISKFTKETSNAKVVWGGVHASMLPSQVINENYVDIVNVGEGDFSFNEIINNINDLKKVHGILFKKDGKVITNRPRQLIKNLDELPQVPWNLVSIKKYAFRWVGGVRTIPLPTSRGCPYNCAYCYNSVFHKNIWRPFSIKNIKTNLNNLLSNYEIGGIKVDYEDNFIGTDLKRAVKLARLFNQYDLKWSCQLRPDQVNRRVLKIFKKNGCEYILFGVESGSPRILKFLRKNITIKKVKKTFEIIDELKIRAAASFILDIPTENERDLQETLKFAKELNCIITAGFYQPYPGTILYSYIVKNKLFTPPMSTEGWANNDFSYCHKFSEIDYRKLKSAYLYLNYYSNLVNLLKNKDWRMLYILAKNTIKSYV